MHIFTAELYWLNNPTPIRFFPYTTIVTNHLFWEYPKELPESIVKLFNEVKEKAIEKGAKWDNKVAVECTIKGFPYPIFFGYIDHALVLGFSVAPEEWCKQWIKEL